jgi:hypothetical protein
LGLKFQIKANASKIGARRGDDPTLLVNLLSNES